MNRRILCVFLLLLVVSPNYAIAAAPAHGATCAEFPAGANACNSNGCFVCTSGAWVDQPLYFGASSATCDAGHEGLQRYNSTTHILEHCNGTAWMGPGQMQSSANLTTCDTSNKGVFRYVSGVTYSSPTVASYSLQATEGGGVSLARPSGTTNGDLLLMIISTDNSATWAWPSGFSDIGAGKVTDSGSTDGQTMGIGWKIAGSSEPVSYSATISGGSLSFSAAMLRITGAGAPYPVDAYDYTAITTGVATPPAITLSSPSITPTVDGTLILWVATGDSNNTGDYSYTDPAGYSHVLGPNNNSVWSSIEVASLAQTSAAATGVLSGTVNLSNSASSTAGIAFSVAIKSPSSTDSVEVCNGTAWKTLGHPY